MLGYGPHDRVANVLADDIGLVDGAVCLGPRRVTEGFCTWRLMWACR